MRLAARASLVIAMLLTTVISIGSPAHAYPNAFFHTQSSGNRGADVLAICPSAGAGDPCRAPGHIVVIWFNDPTLISEGLAARLSNHDNRLHVRYCEKIHPNSLYDC